MSPVLEYRFACLIAKGETFTADDVTADGALAADAYHTANSRQNGIGSMFRKASERALIEFTGDIVRSQAPHRKGGAIRVWRGTEAGRLWAVNTQGVEP